MFNDFEFIHLFNYISFHFLCSYCADTISFCSVKNLQLMSTWKKRLNMHRIPISNVLISIFKLIFKLIIKTSLFYLVFLIIKIYNQYALIRRKTDFGYLMKKLTFLNCSKTNVVNNCQIEGLSIQKQYWVLTILKWVS